MNNQSDSIVEPWPDFEANCFNVESVIYVSDLFIICNARGHFD